MKAKSILIRHFVICLAVGPVILVLADMVTPYAFWLAVPWFFWLAWGPLFYRCSCGARLFEMKIFELKGMPVGPAYYSWKDQCAACDRSL